MRSPLLLRVPGVAGYKNKPAVGPQPAAGLFLISFLRWSVVDPNLYGKTFNIGMREAIRIYPFFNIFECQ